MSVTKNSFELTLVLCDKGEVDFVPCKHYKIILIFLHLFSLQTDIYGLVGKHNIKMISVSLPVALIKE